jgi:hypothetical protein
MPPPPRPPSGRPGPPGRPATPGSTAPGARGAPARPPAAATAGRSSGPIPGSPAALRAAAAAAASATTTTRPLEEDLEARFNRLDRRIQQLKVEFNRFFAGDLAQPPTAMRDEIEAEMRRLRSINMRRSVDGFRFGALEAQMSSYGEMFSRRLRSLEEGKQAPRQQARQPSRKHDVDAGVVVSAHCEEDAVEALLQGLVERSPRGTPAMDIDTFRGYLQRQISQIRDKTGCELVQFRVVTDEGKVKLKAKPVSGG